MPIRPPLRICCCNTSAKGWYSPSPGQRASASQGKPEGAPSEQ
ncbi:hypothetical protein ACSLUB_18505 [Bordetella hinzii]